MTTFWQASKTIVEECFKILKPGGVAVWVTKDFVRKKKRVRFSDDWIRLCQACGFVLLRRARAMQVEYITELGIDGQNIIVKKERKGFFRRMLEAKMAADDERRIDWEDVSIFQKPGTIGVGTLDPFSDPPPETWNNCYGEGWQGEITRASFAHPAKMSRALIRRIFDELDLRVGSTVVDPFAGIFTTGIEAAHRYIQAYGCELEPRFVTMFNGYDCPGSNPPEWMKGKSDGDPCLDCVRLAKLVEKQTGKPNGTYPHRFHGNLDLHRAEWERFQMPIPVMVQGDSTNLRENLADVMADVMADVVVGSPPFMKQQTGGGIATAGTPEQRRYKNAIAPAGYQHQGSHAGQIAAMPSGTIDAVISSPAYGNISAGAGGLNHKPPRKPGQQSGRKKGASQDTDQKYGTSEGQMARMGLE